MSSSTDNEGSLSPERVGVRQRPLQRSNSFLGAIKSFVAAPLSWLSGDKGQDVGEKRALPTVDEVSNDRVTKKQRRLSPRHNERHPSGSSSFEAAHDGISRLTFQKTNGFTPIPEPPPESLTRSNAMLMSVDTKATGRTNHIQNSHQWSSTNSFRSSSHDAFANGLPDFLWVTWDNFTFA